MSFFKKLDKKEVANIANDLFGEVVSNSGNWLTHSYEGGSCNIYFSQTKPSSASKGHWNYDFFHTLKFETVQKICEESGCLLLLNYVDQNYAILNGADLLWLAKYSCREKFSSGLVMDIVIDRSKEGFYRLRSYDRINQSFRKIDVKSWK